MSSLPGEGLFIWTRLPEGLHAETLARQGLRMVRWPPPGLAAAPGSASIPTHFPVGNAAVLAGVVRQLWADPEKLRTMRRNARAAYEHRYSADSNYTTLMKIYEAAMASKAQRAAAAPHTPRTASISISELANTVICAVG